MSAAWELDSLERSLADVGIEATVTESFGDVTVSMPPDRWVDGLTILRDVHGLEYFDWLSAVDEGDDGFGVYSHLYDPRTHRHALAHTNLSRDAPSLASATAVFRGAAWHERETHEMFGVDFTDHPYLAPLLLSDDFDGHPLRKDFVLTARVSKSWPGAKEPGESGHEGAPSRRKMQPPGVPDPSWGPHEPGAPDA